MSAKKQLRTIDKTSCGFHVDDLYEFSAPKFFDFSANMKESGSLIDEKSDHGHDWFEVSHSPSVDGSAQVTPRRPVKLYYSSSAGKSSERRTSTRKKTPPSVCAGRSSTTHVSGTIPSDGSDWKQLPSPMKDGNGAELDNCDALLAELGLSPMPKAIKKGPSMTTKKRKSSPKRNTSGQASKKSTVKPSPLRTQIDAPNKTSGNTACRNSLYKKLFQMKPKEEGPRQKEVNPGMQRSLSKTLMVSAKLKVGADLLPAKSTKPLTIPQEFTFATEKRTKRNNQPNVPSAPKTRPLAHGKPPTQPVSPKFSKPKPAETIVKKAPLAKRPVVEVKVTVPKPPVFATDLRAGSRKIVEHDNDRESKTIFRPKPQVTIPRAPMLSTSMRASKSSINPASVSAATSFLCSPFKARPAPKFGKPFEPVKPHRHTIPMAVHLPGEHLHKRPKVEDGTTTEAMASLSLQTPKRPEKENHAPGNAVPRERKVTKAMSPKLSTTLRTRNRMMQS